LPIWSKAVSRFELFQCSKGQHVMWLTYSTIEDWEEEEEGGGGGDN
jgi:hypothetical protein